LMETGEKLMVAALKTGMDEKTARKYIRAGKLPSEVKESHTWRTRKDPFGKVWDEGLEKLEVFPNLDLFPQHFHPNRRLLLSCPFQPSTTGAFFRYGSTPFPLHRCHESRIFWGITVESSMKTPLRNFFHCACVALTLSE